MCGGERERKREREGEREGREVEEGMQEMVLKCNDPVHLIENWITQISTHNYHNVIIYILSLEGTNKQCNNS